jgi:F0F1-type ATP synthase delta subunit
MAYLPGIARRFGVLAREAEGEWRVRLYTPYSLDAPALEGIRLYLAKRGLIEEAPLDKVSFEVIPDKSLLGGFRAECRGRVLDESIKTRLLKMRGVHGSWH